MFTQQANISVHFIGIGGIGMSGIAEILLMLGYNVSGSDLSENANVQKLKGLGAKITKGHFADNVEGATVVVYSSAIDEENCEIIAARSNKTPIMRRAEMLAELMRLKHGVAIAGTHGKTTTTSFLATILNEAGFDPTYAIGGVVTNLDGHAKVGDGNLLIAEADESDGTFLLLNPIMSVITNIDNDHLDHYGTERGLIKAFKEFANKIPFYGKCALNYHDKRLMNIAKKMTKPWVTFGYEEPRKKNNADYLAKNIISKPEWTEYELHYQGEFVTNISITLPGKHNVLNSLGAISIAHSMGLDFESISKSLKKFKGVRRRFQHLYSAENFEIIDDYAHHPTEILNTLAALKETRKEKTLKVVFEPHRFTRTRDCWQEFLHCFNEADEVHFLPIYPASESEIPGINSERLSEDINKIHPGLTRTMDGYSDLKELIEDSRNKDVAIITLGAGAISRKINELISTFKS